MDQPPEIAARHSEHPKPDSGRGLVRGSTLLLIGRLISIVVGFATQVLIVRHLSKSAFGGFAYALAVVVPVKSIMTLGLDRSVPRFLPIFQEQRDNRRLLGTIAMTLLVILSLGLVTILLLYGFQGRIGGLVRDGQSLSLLLVLIFLAPIQALDDLLINLFAVFAKPRAIFFRRYLLAPALKLAVVIGCIASGSNVFFIAVGYVVSSLVGVAIYGYLFIVELRRHGLLENWSPRGLIMPWRQVLSFSLPILTTELVSMNTMSVLLLGYFWGSSSVANFRAVFPASKLTEVVTSSFTTLFLPTAARMFAKGDPAGINRLYWKTAIWMAIASFPILAVTFSLAQPITVFLYGSRYQESAPILAMLSLGFYFNGALGFNALTLQVFGKVRHILLLNVVTVVLNIVLSLLLVPRLGALGAGIATMISVIIFNVMKQTALRLATGVGTFEWRYGKVYFIIALSALGLLAIQMFASPPIYVSFGLAALIALFVVWANRELLELDKMFPEVMRIPGVRFFVSGPQRRDAVAESEGVRETSPTVPPSDTV